jgi:hypothetical protein
MVAQQVLVKPQTVSKWRSRFLDKGLVALAGDIPQCRQPVQRAILLSFRALANDVDQVAQILPGALLIEVKGGLGLIACAHQRSSLAGSSFEALIFEGVELRLSLCQGVLGAC